jgi:hypothetical protein
MRQIFAWFTVTILARLNAVLALPLLGRSLARPFIHISLSLLLIATDENTMPSGEIVEIDAADNDVAILDASACCALASSSSSSSSSSSPSVAPAPRRGGAGGGGGRGRRTTTTVVGSVVPRR